MEKTNLIAAATLSTLLSAHTHAGAISSTTGHDLKKLCDTGSYICDGYVIGVRDATNEFHCVPVEATNEQLIGVFEKYLDDHPEKLQMHPSLLVVDSLNEVFPCEEGE